MRRHPLALLILASCAAGDAAEDLSLPALHAEQELRIGSVNDPATALTFFRDVAVAPDGRMYTLHRQGSEIRMYDAAGTFVRTIGRAGSGPGEFRSPVNLGIRGDTLWVLDSSTYRFTFFDLDGELIDSRGFLVNVRDGTTPRPYAILPDHGILGVGMAWSEGIADGEITEVPFVRFDSAGGIIDTIAVMPVAGTVWRLAEANRDGVQSYMDQPFSETPLVVLAEHASEVIVVERPAAGAPDVASFRVTKLAYGGDTMFTRAFRYRPRAIDPAMPDSLSRVFAGFLKQIPPGMQAPVPTFERGAELAREALHLPPHHPPVRQVVPGMDGTIWLAREDHGGEPLTWWVLDADGEPIGEVQLPRGIEVMAADRSHVWGMERDELDVPYLVRYAIGSTP